MASTASKSSSAPAVPAKNAGFLKRMYEEIIRICIRIMEKNIVPTFLIRRGIRYLINNKGIETAPTCGEDHQSRLQLFVEDLKSMPVAINTAEANIQHYEVPSEYFTLALGKNLKYSSCLYSDARDFTLEEAEVAMLELTCQRADLKDGQTILELGCGWGSLSLYMAAKYPNAKITSVSNSRTQKLHIDAQAAQRGIKNLTIITANVVEFDTDADQFDRCVSVEMFEHMKNYDILLNRISKWLKSEGKLFVHIFVSTHLPYHYLVESEDDFMAKYFFLGGTMPSRDLLLYFQRDLAIEKHWYVNGVHYSKTLEAWLRKHDANYKTIIPLFEETYGKGNAVKWFVYWRLFYIACSEFFAFNGGNRWGVGHYLFSNKKK
jgi:cyclopropane-fatty-acyl-phospholipid synthase